MDDEEKGLLDRLRERGEEVFTQLSGELMSNRHFMKAMEGAMRGKQKLDEAAAKALKTMNVPTRTEFKKAMTRIETLEEELVSLRARMKASGGTGAAKSSTRKGPGKGAARGPRSK